LSPDCSDNTYAVGASNSTNGDLAIVKVGSSAGSCQAHICFGIGKIKAGCRSAGSISGVGTLEGDCSLVTLNSRKTERFDQLTIQGDFESSIIERSTAFAREKVAYSDIFEFDLIKNCVASSPQLQH
jgi:hypothetical protein